jgi:hypothetical protein
MVGAPLIRTTNESVDYVVHDLLGVVSVVDLGEVFDIEKKIDTCSILM